MKKVYTISYTIQRLSLMAGFIFAIKTLLMLVLKQSHQSSLNWMIIMALTHIVSTVVSAYFYRDDFYPNDDQEKSYGAKRTEVPLVEKR